MTQTAEAPARAERAGKYLTFFLAGEEYGVPILKVREILGMLPVTRVPHTPAHVLGVINLRGKVVPVVELRARLGMGAGDAARPCIVVVHARGVEFGLVVDRMSEVAAVLAEDVQDVPDFGAAVDTAFLLGMARTGTRVRLLLDLERVLSAGELGDLQAAADRAAAPSPA